MPTRLHLQLTAYCFAKSFNHRLKPTYDVTPRACRKDHILGGGEGGSMSRLFSVYHYACRVHRAPYNIIIFHTKRKDFRLNADEYGSAHRADRSLYAGY